MKGACIYILSDKPLGQTLQRSHPDSLHQMGRLHQIVSRQTARFAHPLMCCQGRTCLDQKHLCWPSLADHSVLATCGPQYVLAQVLIIMAGGTRV